MMDAATSVSLEPRLRERLLRRLNARRYTVFSLASLVGLFLVWWGTTSAHLVPSQDLPTVGSMVGTFQSLIRYGYNGVSLWGHISSSLQTCLLGFCLGAGLGVPFGLLSGYYRAASAVMSPALALVRPVPPIAYLPLMVTFLGIGEAPKIVLIALAAFVYTVLSTAAGVRMVPHSYVQAALTLGLSRRQLFTSVVFRAALPQILTGINISLVISWATVVAAELIASDKGLGYMALNASALYEVNVIYAAVILIGLIGAAFEYGIRLLERLLLPWAGKQ